MNLPPFVLVAIGGAAGAMARYSASLLIPSQQGFPWATFAVNLLGSFLIGLAWGLFGGREGTEAWSLLLVTGVLGGFTTFSAFSLEMLKMVQSGQWPAALGYAAASASLGLALAALGAALAPR